MALTFSICAAVARRVHEELFIAWTMGRSRLAVTRCAVADAPGGSGRDLRQLAAIDQMKDPAMNDTWRTRLDMMLNKVPEVTLAFWVIKIMSTTVGETGADYLAVHVGLGTAVTDGDHGRVC